DLGAFAVGDGVCQRGRKWRWAIEPLALKWVNPLKEAQLGWHRCPFLNVTLERQHCRLGSQDGSERGAVRRSHASHGKFVLSAILNSTRTSMLTEPGKRRKIVGRAYVFAGTTGESAGGGI